jgi:hypothetical protein
VNVVIAALAAPLAAAWVPPSHPAPAGSIFLDPLLYILNLFARLRFFALPLVFIIIPLAIALLRKPGTIRVTSAHRNFAVPIIAAGILFFFFGTQLAASLIYLCGEAGGATITGTYKTSTQYNNHNVVGYNVLIRTAAGRIVATKFEDDDFNVYPPWRNVVSYPQDGDAFTVRYLERFPSAFVIVANDNSPWALDVRCAKLAEPLDEAKRKLQFARSDETFQRDYRDAREALRQAGC